MFHLVLAINSHCFPNSINQLGFVARRNVFPVRYELYLNILFGRNLVFRGLNHYLDYSYF
jgi:hypothetical protein